MSLILQLHLDRVRSLRNIIEPWGKGTDAVLPMLDAEELIRETLEFCARVRSMAQGELRRAWAEENPQVAPLQQERERIEELLRDLSVEIERVRGLVERAEAASGRRLESLPKLASAATDLDSLKAEVADKWPVCNQAELAEARAAMARGEGVDLADAFAQIAGVSRETWLARAEERRRQNTAR